MAPTRMRKRALYIAAETGGFAVDPSSNGSGYVAVRASEIGAFTDETALLDTSYFLGRNVTTETVVGSRGGSLTFRIPLTGLASAAGDGTNASSVTADAVDIILTAAFGATTTTAGEGVGVGSTTSDLVLDTSAYAAQDIVCVQDSAILSGRSQVRRLGNASTPYSLNYDWSAAPETTGVAFGGKHWRGPVSAGGDSISAVLVMDDERWYLAGGRPTALSIEMTAGQMAFLVGTLQFDSKSSGASKSSLPTLSAWSQTPIVGQLSAFQFAGTEYAASTITINFGISAKPIASVAGTYGRSNIDVMRADPTVAVSVPYTALASWWTSAITPTRSNLTVKLGAGTAAAPNVVAFHAEKAELALPADEDADNEARQSITFTVRDPGVFSGAVIGHYFQVSRF